MTKTKRIRLHTEAGYPSPGDVVGLKEDVQYYSSPKRMKDTIRFVRRKPHPALVIGFNEFLEAMMVMPLGAARYYWVFPSDIDETPKWRT